MSRRSKLAVSVSILAALGIAASAAWACTALATVSLSPREGLPGDPVTVTVRAFNPGPVEIRWGSNDGRLLGTAPSENSSVKVTIPADADPGSRFIIGIQTRDGEVIGRNLATFQVRGEAPEASSPEEAESQSASRPAPSQASAPDNLGPAPASSPQPVAEQAGFTSPSSTPPVAASARAGAATTGRSAPVVNSPLPAAEVTGPGPGADQVPDQPAARSDGDSSSPPAGLRDLWSGFASGVDPRSAAADSGGSMSRPRALPLGVAPTGLMVAASAALLFLAIAVLLSRSRSKAPNPGGSPENG